MRVSEGVREGGREGGEVGEVVLGEVSEVPSRCVGISISISRVAS